MNKHADEHLNNIFRSEIIIVLYVFTLQWILIESTLHARGRNSRVHEKLTYIINALDSQQAGRSGQRPDRRRPPHRPAPRVLSHAYLHVPRFACGKLDHKRDLLALSDLDYHV